MNKENKVISLKLAKKIYDKAKEKGFELPESEMCWAENSYLIEGYKVEGKKEVLTSGGIIPLEVYPAYDIAELWEIIPGNVGGYYFQTQKGLMGNMFYCSALIMEDNRIIHQEEEKTIAEAMGKMFYYLLDNDLL